jgi:hypothetical protein
LTEKVFIAPLQVFNLALDSNYLQFCFNFYSAETQLVSALANNDALYCIETPQLRETTENGAFLMIAWTNILVTNENDNNMKVRFGSTYVTQIARETGSVDLQKILLKEMSGILQSGILVAEQKVFQHL